MFPWAGLEHDVWRVNPVSRPVDRGPVEITEECSYSHNVFGIARRPWPDLVYGDEYTGTALVGFFKLTRYVLKPPVPHLDEPLVFARLVIVECLESELPVRGQHTKEASRFRKV